MYIQMFNVVLLGNCKLKSHCNTITHLNGQNLKHLSTPNSNGEVEQQELPFIPGGNAKWCGHLEDSLSVPEKLYIHSPYNVAIAVLTIYTNELTNFMSTQKPAHGYLLLLYLKLPKLGSNKDVLQKVNE